MSPRRVLLLLNFFLLAVAGPLHADDGYRLWLRYDAITDAGLKARYTGAVEQIRLNTPRGTESATIAAARDELTTGLRGLLGVEPKFTLVSESDKPLAPEAYSLVRQGNAVTISGGSDVGVLYGAFALLRHLQLHQPLERLAVTSAPKIARRMLNHWDNLTRSVERGYAGQSLWEWDKLPGELSPRYRDYARANASLGLNGVVPVNVNANAQFLTPPFIAKFAALAGVFRPYGIRLYLTARFSAPIEIGNLKTADPLDPDVIQWWVGSSRVDLQACKLEYSIVSPK